MRIMVTAGEYRTGRKHSLPPSTTSTSASDKTRCPRGMHEANCYTDIMRTSDESCFSNRSFITPTGYHKESTRTLSCLRRSWIVISPRLVLQSYVFDHVECSPHHGNFDNHVVSSARHKGRMVGRSGRECDGCDGEQRRDRVFKSA
jgi:hypothetical protein